MIGIPLGTVSPYCKKDKNCPGFLVKDKDSKILLDCGSGISRLLKFPNYLENLTIIISHLHKDHYSDLSSLGYASFVYKNLGLLNKKIKVYIPNDINCPDLMFFKNFGNENFLEFLYYESEDILSINNLTISFCRNPHPILTNSIKITNSKKTLVYSSDTGFINNALTKFSLNCDLLICESTFLKEQSHNNSNHLCAEEAALIAKKANAKKLILTHFWPEISKKHYVKEARKFFKNTYAAKENEKIYL